MRRGCFCSVYILIDCNNRILLEQVYVCTTGEFTRMAFQKHCLVNSTFRCSVDRDRERRSPSVLERYVAPTKKGFRLRSFRGVPATLFQTCTLVKGRSIFGRIGRLKTPPPPSKTPIGIAKALLSSFFCVHVRCATLCLMVNSLN